MKSTRNWTLKPEYNQLGDELLRRTWDESGHWYLKISPFSVRESLNDGKNNRGIYSQDNWQNRFWVSLVSIC